MYVCLCKGLTEADIQRAIGQESRISATVVAALGLDDEAACGRCLHDIDDLLTPTSGNGAGLLPSLAGPLAAPTPRLAQSGSI